MRWEAQKWLLHPDKDGRELISAWSGEKEARAEEAAIDYASALEKAGYALGPGKTGEIWATRGNVTYAIRVEQKP